MPNFSKHLFCGAIFDFHDFQKGTFWTTFSCSRPPNPTTPNDEKRPSADPAFHETMVITVPFGPSVFFNVIFAIKIWSLSVFSAFLCAMFYMVFLSQLLIISQ